MVDKISVEKLFNSLDILKVKESKLISSYEEGYIGKKVFKVTLNDGSTRMCEQITKNKRNGDAVVIIPITESGNFVMIVESRPNTRETVAIEFPAGMVDENEEYIESARRELLEETGYQASNIYELEWHYQDQGCSKAIIKTFVAQDCIKVQDKKLSDGERLEYVEMSYDDILGLLKKDALNDANTKIALMNYTLKKKGIL